MTDPYKWEPRPHETKCHAYYWRTVTCHCKGTRDWNCRRRDDAVGLQGLCTFFQQMQVPEFWHSRFVPISDLRDRPHEFIDSVPLWGADSVPLYRYHVAQPAAEQTRRVYLNLAQAQNIVECFGGEDADVVVEEFGASVDAETGEAMPAGLYLWFADYPEEGRIAIDEDATAPQPDPQGGVNVRPLYEVEHRDDPEHGAATGWMLRKNYIDPNGIEGAALLPIRKLLKAYERAQASVPEGFVLEQVGCRVRSVMPDGWKGEWFYTGGNPYPDGANEWVEVQETFVLSAAPGKEEAR